MEVINGSERIPPRKGPFYIALGNFDGVHRGHQAILRATVLMAREEGGESAALLFDPHPLSVLHPDKKLVLLTDIADRARIMQELGIDYLVVEPFVEEFFTLTPELFARRFLKEKLGAAGVVIGENYSFGYRGTGRAETMRALGGELGFSVEISPVLRIKGRQVSSSAIRSLVRAGAVDEAAELLNYFFFRQGRVIRGQGIGAKMLYPTANIAAGPRLLWPGSGVYLTAVGNLEGGLQFGVTHVGPRPTFKDRGTVVETHIINFNGSIYHREIRICFLEKLRDTRCFDSPQQLKEQINNDIERGRKLMVRYLEENKGRNNSLQSGCSVLRSV